MLTRPIGGYIPPPQALLARFEVGLAERGQRRVEGPPFELDQFGLDSYVDPDCPLYIGRDTKAKARLLNFVM